MKYPSEKSDKKWTYVDYLTWNDGQRWELIDGVAYCMTPAPNWQHQRVSAALIYQLYGYLKDKACKVLPAPFDIRLSEQSNVSDNYIDTVVQPDIVVVCDKAKLDERGCNGPPDMVIEILSPSTAAHDFKVKFELYQRFGVLEYWMIHPLDQTLLVYKLSKDGMYGAADRYAGDDLVSVPLLGDLVINLAGVFAE